MNCQATDVSLRRTSHNSPACLPVLFVPSHACKDPCNFNSIRHLHFLTSFFRSSCRNSSPPQISSYADRLAISSGLADLVRLLLPSSASIYP